MASKLSNPIVLDVGCGDWKVEGAIGIDVRSTKEAEIVISERNYRLPYADETVDMIYLNHVIEHSDTLTLLRECYRALRIGASIHVETPNAYYLPVLLRFVLKGVYCVSHDHIHTYGPHELCSLLYRVGFKIKNVAYEDYKTRHSKTPWYMWLSPDRFRGVIVTEAYK